MSIQVETSSPVEAKVSSKRKRDDELAELEVDINAAEPPSKKALRKAKRSKLATTLHPEASSKAVESTSFVPLNQEPVTDNASRTTTSRSQWGIWIGNLSFATTKDDLIHFLTSDLDHPITQDEITRIHLPPGPARAGKPQNKGFAYIDFTSETALNNGLELSEKLLAGRRVLIKNAKSFEGRPASKEQVESGKSPSRKIFVGNLAFDTTTEALEEHFGVCGSIQKVHVATFEDSGKCKGYAWVEFESLDAARAAMRGWIETEGGANGGGRKKRVWLRKIGGRELRMEFAEDSTTRYNKRYGKDAKSKAKGEGSEVEQQAPIEEVREEPKRERMKKDFKPKTRTGYEAGTVQRLTGAITEGQGKKVTFE